ncbi:hypothetical protein P5G61_13195 [Paenibacillus sp. F6_3S_P_1C]|uniref:UmuC domain-containing protein n=1 Tax=Paenibacillus vandeheii TaxID=3035917 RepID=A0ABT8JAP9_9BACL|nr:hypothetical protein [Paenibacillus vandeheii]MDN4602184.1 hypothetical protein [Paenibacillus vandeheii]
MHLLLFPIGLLVRSYHQLEHLFDNDPVDLAKQIQDKIYNETGVYARAGIGENKIISKLCCDMIVKKAEGGIFHLKKRGFTPPHWR